VNQLVLPLRGNGAAGGGQCFGAAAALPDFVGLLTLPFFTALIVVARRTVLGMVLR
jgi:hypothetical protein